MTLSPGQLNNTDERILSTLQDGRVTPQYLVDELDVSQPYASNHIRWLVKHGHVRQLTPGLYELVDDPREDVDDPTDSKKIAAWRVQELKAERNRLQERVGILEDQLQECREQRDSEGNHARTDGGVDPDIVAGAAANIRSHPSGQRRVPPGRDRVVRA